MATGSTKKRKRAPRGSGKDPMLALRAPPTLTARVEDWAKRQADNPSRSEALRRLVEMALEAQGKRRG